MNSFIQQWNESKVFIKAQKSVFARKGQMLLGTKRPHYTLPRAVWHDEEEFLRNAVSIPFRNDIRKPARAILIGGSRIGKTTLVSNLEDDLENDFRVPTLAFYPKGRDAYFHNRKGIGKWLCPGEYNRALKRDLYLPLYKKDDIPQALQAGLRRFAFELYDFNPNNDPGFLEDDPQDYSKSLYMQLSIMQDVFPHLKGATCKEMLEALDKHTYQSTKFIRPGQIFMPFTTHESLKTRLQGALSKQFLSGKGHRITPETFINSWESGRSHAFMFFADSNDPRVQSYTAKILKVAQEAKMRHNLLRKKRGLKPLPVWLILDDTRELAASWMNSERYRAKKEIERCIYMYGEYGWNTLMVYHNAEDVPRGLLKEADFIICSRLDSADAKLLPDIAFQETVQRLFIKPYYYYNEWAVRSKDGQIRRFFAIDSRVGLA